MKETHSDKIPRSLTGYLVAFVNESIDYRDICIYGDPEGLRSLGEALIAIANLDQSSLSNAECPPDDSFHQHYKQGLPGLPRLTVGRVDEKASGERRDFFPQPAGDADG